MAGAGAGPRTIGDFVVGMIPANPGKAEDLIAAREAQEKGASVEPSAPEAAVITEFGAVAALFDIATRLDLVRYVDRHAPKRGSGPSVGTYMLVATCYRASGSWARREAGDPPPGNTGIMTEGTAR